MKGLIAYLFLKKKMDFKEVSCKLSTSVVETHYSLK